MTDHFVVTGTGRSGTLWCAETLRAYGVRCGHQDVFRHEHVLGETGWSWGDYDGDASFEAVPMLDRIDARVVLVVRHPLAVARSWIGLGVFGPYMRSHWELLSRSLDTYFPDVLAQPTPTAQALEFWCEWNRAALAHADAGLLIEEMTPRRLLEAVGYGRLYDDDAVIPARTTNSRSAEKHFGYLYDPAEVDAELWAKVNETAALFGYPTVFGT